MINTDTEKYYTLLCIRMDLYTYVNTWLHDWQLHHMRGGALQIELSVQRELPIVEETVQSWVYF